MISLPNRFLHVGIYWFFCANFGYCQIPDGQVQQLIFPAGNSIWKAGEIRKFKEDKDKDRFLSTIETPELKLLLKAVQGNRHALLVQWLRYANGSEQAKQDAEGIDEVEFYWSLLFLPMRFRFTPGELEEGYRAFTQEPHTKLRKIMGELLLQAQQRTTQPDASH